MKQKSLWNRLGKGIFSLFMVCAITCTTVMQVSAFEGDYKPYQQGTQDSNHIVESESENKTEESISGFSSMASNAGLSSTGLTQANNLRASTRGTEIEIGKSNTASWNGGQFYERMTKEFISENNNNDTVVYRIRYRVKHWGGGYTYQTGAVQLWVDGRHITSYSAYIGVHLNNTDAVLGSTDITLSKGVNHTIEFRDPGGSGMTAINVSGIVYHALPTYTVTFVNGYGGTVKTQTVTKYQSASAPSVSRAGYTFAGWSGTYTNVTSNRTITATWSPNTYQVKYNANGGTNAPATQNFVFNSGAKISTGKPTRTGYTFTGWISNPNNTAFAPGASIPTGWGSFELIAQWKINQYTVTFDSNGGSAVSPQTVNYGSKISRPSNPTRSGYTFVGWYKNSALTTAYDFDAAVTGNMTLYAKWNKNPVMSGVDIYMIQGLDFSNRRLITGQDTFIKSPITAYPDKLMKGNYPVTAKDAEDGDITSSIKITSIRHSDGTNVSVNANNTFSTNKLGTYTVTYSVTDKGGATTSYVRKLTVLPFSIATIDANDRYFYKDSTITDADLLSKVKASDKYDGDISSKVKIISNTINASVTGDYTVRYSITNTSNKITVKDITVHIVDRVADEAKNESIRYIEEDYLDTLDSQSKWVTDQSLNQKLTQSLRKESSTNNAKREYTFSKEEVKEVQEFSKNHGYSQSVNQLFNNIFERCQIK